MDFKYNKKPLYNINKELKLNKENIKGIVLFCETDLYNKNAATEGYEQLKKRNIEKENYGYHYSIDATDDSTICTHIETDAQAINLNGKASFISRALFSEKPQEHTISIHMYIKDNYDYEVVEQKTFHFIVKLLKEYDLTAKDLWRGFDLTKESYSPFHMLNTSIFKLYIKELEKFIPPILNEGGVNESFDKETLVEDKVEEEAPEFISPFKDLAEEANLSINEYVHKIFERHITDPAAYASKFQQWDKDRDDTKVNNEIAGELQTRETPYGNNLQFKISELPPAGLDHCEKPVDKLEAIETAKDTLVEPIYPDLITPPGSEVHIADGFSETKVQSSSNTALTVEEFEKKQKVFDIANFSNIKKETLGRPINVEDAFPVDDQIKKLEEHFPKVKIDKVTFDFLDDNHPNSAIGNAMAKNYAMCYDMVTEVAKRTEQRLVKIENNLSTVMRNLFRMSARVNVNCVYYGGQSVYGKYKCIRCMHDDRINDGDVVSLDQCLNCTRYEPILGQVYAILDETGSNVVQVMDDIQSSYMDLADFNSLNKNNRKYQPPNNAKVNDNPAETPKPFIEDKWKDTEEEVKAKEGNNKTTSSDSDSDEKNENEDKEVKYVNGFKMDWNPVPLETQRPNVNKYDAENLKAEKTAINSDNQGIDRTIFIDTREKAIEYEKLEFDVSNYDFPDFGSKATSGGGSNGHFGMGAMDVRQKIVDYALNAVQLCKDNRAGYSQAHRHCHDGCKPCGQHIGTSYWDCSSLTHDAYKSAGIPNIGNVTYEQFENFKSTNGGLLFPLTQMDQALIGDIVFFYDGQPKDLSTEQLQQVNKSGIRHVAIYVGEGKIAHASSEKWGIVHTDINWDKGSFCIGRPKTLIELDQQASAGSGYWNREYHGIPDKIWNLANSAEGNAEKAIGNMKKYNYKDIIIKVAKEFKYDPYWVFAIAATESGGDPTVGGYGGQEGLMQTDNGRPASTPQGIEEHIRLALGNITRKKSMLKQHGWTEDNLAVLTHAYNCGEGSVTTAAGSFQQDKFPMPKVNLSTCKIPEIAEALGVYAEKYKKLSLPDARRAYSSKVLRAYNYLIARNPLEIPLQTSEGGPVPTNMPPIQKKQIAYNRSSRNSAIKYIVIHDTDNPGGTAQNHFDYFNGGDRKSSADYFVDNNNVIEISNPNTYYTWHVGDGQGKKGITNSNSLGIEMCLENNGTVSTNTYNYTINLTKYLMKLHNVPVSNVVRHCDASGKICPKQLSSNTWSRWNDFKSKIQK